MFSKCQMIGIVVPSRCIIGSTQRATDVGTCMYSHSRYACCFSDSPGGAIFAYSADATAIGRLNYQRIWANECTLWFTVQANVHQYIVVPVVSAAATVVIGRTGAAAVLVVIVVIAAVAAVSFYHICCADIRANIFAFLISFAFSRLLIPPWDMGYGYL